jgi:LppX_LprAFG lipoprotein
MRALVPVLAAIALAASACGGDAVALDPVAKAADTTAKQVSEHVEFTATINAANGTQVTMNGTGDFQNNPQVGQLTLTFASAQGSSSIQEVMNNWTIYMSSPLFARFLPAGKTWMSLDMKKATKALGVDITSFSSQSPTQALEQLKRTGSVTRVGRAKIDGAATTHYNAVVDLSKAPNGGKIVKASGVRFVPVDAWIGAGGLVRRLEMNYSLAQGSMKMRMDFSHYGEPVTVAVPSDAVTYDATDAATK